MTHWMVVPGPASKELGESIAKRLGTEIVSVESTIFPDGEIKIRFLNDISNESVIIVQSTYPPVDRHLFELLFMAHRLSEHGARVYALIPYLSYARQDNEFLKGEVISLSVLARLMRTVGVQRLDTIDIHSVKGLGFFPFPSYSLSAVPFLARHFKDNVELKDPVAVSPDAGGAARTEGFANTLGIEYVVLHKTRDRVTGEVSINEDIQSVEDRDVVLIDDVISTGGSIAKAAVLLKKRGAKRIYAACTHLLLIGNALERMMGAGVTEVVGTNTVPSSISKIDVAPLCATHLSSISS